MWCRPVSELGSTAWKSRCKSTKLLLLSRYTRTLELVRQQCSTIIMLIAIQIDIVHRNKTRITTYKDTNQFKTKLPPVTLHLEDQSLTH